MEIRVKDLEHLKRIIAVGCTRFRWSTKNQDASFNIVCVLRELDVWYTRNIIHAERYCSEPYLECIDINAHQIMRIECDNTC